MTDILETALAINLARTLLHSLWQSAALMLVLVVILRLFPSMRSSLRYGFATGTLFLLAFINIGTLLYLEADSSSHEVTASPLTTQLTPFIFRPVDALTWSASYSTWIRVATPYLLVTWITGAALFLIRLGGSWLFIIRLKQKARFINNALTTRLNELASSLEVSRTISLAESTLIQTPIVIGCLKPILFIPMGMLGGLSGDQVEAIFMHELAHIKRNDFIINILQSVIEALLFFNPFVWMISRIIRTEREHCCDDAVVLNGGNTHAYVFALARLEEVRLNTSPLLLSMGGAKHELLNRIKRLMEKSVKQYSMKEKMIPAVLLIVGLICASWIGIKSSPRSTLLSLHRAQPVASDTTIKQKQKSASFSRKKIVTVGPNGEPYEEVTEAFSGDEDLKSMLTSFDFNFVHDYPLPPAVNTFMPAMMPMPPMFSMVDSIPPHHRPFDAEEWKAFEEAFSKKFQERFKDFYSANEKELEQLMSEFERDFKSTYFTPREIEAMAREHEAFARQQERMALKQAEVARHHEERARRDREWVERNDEHVRRQEEQARHQEALAREMEKHNKAWEAVHNKRMKELEKEMKVFEEKMKKFEVALRSELVKDGYIGKNGKIERMGWNENDEMVINDKKIKDKDKKKYKDLHEKYLGKMKGNFHYSE